MSIATLKRKTQTQYNNMSVGSKQGFSLNGTHRSQGYVGQTSLSRSLPRTLMRGNTIRGHGGCCGKYEVKPIVQSGVQTLENSTVIKPSVVNTKGMIDTQYRWIRRPYPYAVIKPDATSNLNTQDDYIIRLKKSTIKDADACHQTAPCDAKTCFNYNPYYRKTIYNYTKPESDYLPISSGDYIMKLHDKCSALDVVTVQNTNQSTPFACGVV